MLTVCYKEYCSLPILYAVCLGSFGRLRFFRFFFFYVHDLFECPGRPSVQLCFVEQTSCLPAVVIAELIVVAGGAKCASRADDVRVGLTSELDPLT